MRSSFDKDVYDMEGRKRVVVCGTRTFDDPKLMKEKLDIYLFFLHDPIIIIRGGGGAKDWDPADGKWVGTDYYVEQYATKKLWRIEVHWIPSGKEKVPKRVEARDQEMLKSADFCIFFWDGESRGTLNMIEEARKLGKAVKIVRFDKIRRRK